MRRTAEFRKYCPPDFRLDLLPAGLLELFVRSPRNQIHFNGTTNFWNIATAFTLSCIYQQIQRYNKCQRNSYLRY